MPEIDIGFALLRQEWEAVNQYLQEYPPESRIPALLHQGCPEKAGIALSLATSKYLHTDDLERAQILWQYIMKTVYNFHPGSAELFEERWTASIAAYCRDNGLPFSREDYGLL
jgi:hypothetical protein